MSGPPLGRRIFRVAVQGSSRFCCRQKASGSRRGDTQSRRRKVWPSQAAIWIGPDHGEVGGHVDGTDFAQFSGDEPGAGAAASLFINLFTVSCLDQDGIR